MSHQTIYAVHVPPAAVPQLDEAKRHLAAANRAITVNEAANAIFLAGLAAIAHLAKHDPVALANLARGAIFNEQGQPV